MTIGASRSSADELEEGDLEQPLARHDAPRARGTRRRAPCSRRRRRGGPPVASAATVTQPAAGGVERAAEEGGHAVGERELRDVERVREREAAGRRDELGDRVGRRGRRASRRRGSRAGGSPGPGPRPRGPRSCRRSGRAAGTPGPPRAVKKSSSGQRSQGIAGQRRTASRTAAATQRATCSVRKRRERRRDAGYGESPLAGAARASPSSG